MASVADVTRYVDALPQATWADTSVPQQLHLDTSVRDVLEVDAVHDRVLALGGMLRQDRADDLEEPLRVYADPDGHLFCVFVTDGQVLFDEPALPSAGGGSSPEATGRLMRKVTCSMGVSLDGYIAGPDGSFAWSGPDEEVHRFATDEVRGLAVHLLGRRLYETMSYWETVDQESVSDLERVFARVWTSLPKVVFSTTVDSVLDGYRLAAGSLAEEVARWRALPGAGDIGIGGATLAAEAFALGLIDEYRLRVHPVLVGGGTPFFSRAGRREDLDLVDTRTFDSGVVHLHYRVRR